jgi:Fur family ferric uptake transcriptional regulator
MTSPDMSWFWKDLDSYLLKNKLKQTKQRQLIVEEFLKLNPHVEADLLYSEMRKKGQTIGIATIYRTLNLLTDAKLVEQRVSQDGKSFFELSFPNSHHDHLTCLDCGKIVEFENNDIENLQLKVAGQYGFQLASHRLELYGFCINKKNCSYKVSPKK